MGATQLGGKQIGPLDLTTEVTGLLPVANGGSGVGTLTGILKGNGTSAFTAVTAPSGTIVGTTDTQTLTNKRVDPRTNTEASNATPTPNADTTDIHTITALAANITTFNAPSGTPVNGQRLIIRIKDNGTARTISGWSGTYRAMGVTLPSTTVISKTMYLGFIYNSTDSKWDLIAKAEEA